MVESDERFEIVGEVTLGLVCFRLKQTNELNEKLLKSINEAGKIYMVPSKINNVYFLRFAVCAVSTEKRHIEEAWNIILNWTLDLDTIKHYGGITIFLCTILSFIVTYHLNVM